MYVCIESESEPCRPVTNDSGHTVTARCLRCGVIQSKKQWNKEGCKIRLKKRKKMHRVDRFALALGMRSGDCQYCGTRTVSNKRGTKDKLTCSQCQS